MLLLEMNEENKYCGVIFTLTLSCSVYNEYDRIVIVFVNTPTMQRLLVTLLHYYIIVLVMRIQFQRNKNVLQPLYLMQQ